MNNLHSNIIIRVNENTFLKDPESSQLGQRIISKSIEMIEEIGFDQFTFRKLGSAIQSTEASIYRYFESKHKLLVYLMSWYWGWMEYLLVFGLTNIDCPQKRLEKALEIITSPANQDNNFGHINEVKLHHIVIAESPKVYLTKAVDEENNEGFFTGYKSVVDRIGKIILELNPEFKYPNMLISTVIEGAHHQRFFAEHLPKLTNVIEGEDSPKMFFKKMVFSTIQNN